jgi:hypothetical protein
LQVYEVLNWPSGLLAWYHYNTIDTFPEEKEKVNSILSVKWWERKFVMKCNFLFLFDCAFPNRYSVL